MSTHEGVSCDNCMKSNFSGIRYKCLICYDFDLCESCRHFDSTTTNHRASHPMQPILTPADFNLFYSGENISPENPPAFVCPYCGKLGFTEALLTEHVVKEHSNDRTEVVCPICAAMPSGEPNLVTDDLANHLQNEHRGARDIDDPTSGRQMRRPLYPGRGMRNRNHRTMNFSGGPLATSNSTTAQLSSNSNTTTSVASRDMDPIAELLSQLSGVRRNAQILQQVVSSETHINEIQSKLQLERQRAAEIRQQLQRFPIKTATAVGQNNSSNNANTTSTQSANSNQMSSKQPSTSSSGDSNKQRSVSDEDESRYLLNNLDEIVAAEDNSQQNCATEKSLFVQELLLAMLSSNNSPTTTNTPPPPASSSNMHQQQSTHQATSNNSSSVNTAAASSGSKSSAPTSCNKAKSNKLAAVSNTSSNKQQNTGGKFPPTADELTINTGNSAAAPQQQAATNNMSNGGGGTQVKRNPAAATQLRNHSNKQLPSGVQVHEKESSRNDVDVDDDRPPSPTSYHHQEAVAGTTTGPPGGSTVHHRCPTGSTMTTTSTATAAGCNSNAASSNQDSQGPTVAAKNNINR